MSICLTTPGNVNNRFCLENRSTHVLYIKFFFGNSLVSIYYNFRAIPFSFFHISSIASHIVITVKFFCFLSTRFPTLASSRKFGVLLIRSSQVYAIVLSSLFAPKRASYLPYVSKSCSTVLFNGVCISFPTL
jgi:hypothetical protein